MEDRIFIPVIYELIIKTFEESTGSVVPEKSKKELQLLLENWKEMAFYYQEKEKEEGANKWITKSL